MYLRFIAKTKDQHSGTYAGIFTAAYRLRDSQQLIGYEEEWLNEYLAWYVQNLQLPPCLKKRGHCQYICWFKNNKNEPLQRIWDLVALLREHGAYTEMITKRNPGIIIYEDDNQVVAKARS